MRGRRHGLAALGAVLAAVGAPGAATAAAPSGWTSPQAVQPGQHPLLALAPNGAAVLVSQARGGATLRRRSASGRLGAPLTLAAPARRLVPAALALGGDGTAALAWADPSRPAPVRGELVGARATRAGRPQTLIGAGQAPAGQGAPDTVTLTSTPQGAIVGAGADGSGGLVSLRRGAGASRFVVGSAPSNLGASDAYALTVDPSGDTFLAGDGPGGCTAVAFAPPRAALRGTYATGNCVSATPNLFDTLAAGPHGGAALLTEDVSEAGTGASRLLLQTGRGGRFGAATALGGALGGDVGAAADAAGGLTVAWTGCQAGPVVGGQLSLVGCEIDGATGTVGAGVSPSAAAGTTLLGAASGQTVSETTAPGGVLAARCEAGQCGLYGITVTPGGTFRAPVGLGAARQSLGLRGDGHGHLLALWLDPQGRLTAATAGTAGGSWSVHRLSSRTVGSDQVAAGFVGGRPLAVWSEGGQLRLATGP